MEIINDKKLLNHYLKKHQIYSLLTNDYSDSFELFYFSKNEFIIKQGYESNYLFFLVSGTVRFICLTESGSIIPFGVADGLVILGEVASLHQQDPDSSVQATSEVYCIGLSLSKNRDKLLSDIKFLQYIIDTLSNKVQALDRSITSYLSGTITERLVSYIIQHNNNGILTVTIKNCADSIGGSYRQTSRIINDLVKKGALKKINGRYTIINKTLLLSQGKKTNNTY